MTEKIFFLIAFFMFVAIFVMWMKTLRKQLNFGPRSAEVMRRRTQYRHQASLTRHLK